MDYPFFSPEIIEWEEIDLEEIEWKSGDICKIIHKNILANVINVEDNRILIDPDFNGELCYVKSLEIEKIECLFKQGDLVNIIKQPLEDGFLDFELPLITNKILEIKWHSDNFKPNRCRRRLVKPVLTFVD